MFLIAVNWEKTKTKFHAFITKCMLVWLTTEIMPKTNDQNNVLPNYICNDQDQQKFLKTQTIEEKQ